MQSCRHSHFFLFKKKRVLRSLDQIMRARYSNITSSFLYFINLYFSINFSNLEHKLKCFGEIYRLQYFTFTHCVCARKSWNAIEKRFSVIPEEVQKKKSQKNLLHCEWCKAPFRHWMLLKKKLITFLLSLQFEYIAALLIIPFYGVREETFGNHNVIRRELIELFQLAWAYPANKNWIFI